MWLAAVPAFAGTHGSMAKQTGASSTRSSISAASQSDTRKPPSSFAAMLALAAAMSLDALHVNTA
jgi:hypothetical protein